MRKPKKIAPPKFLTKPKEVKTFTEVSGLDTTMQFRLELMEKAIAAGYKSVRKYLEGEGDEMLARWVLVRKLDGQLRLRAQEITLNPKQKATPYVKAEEVDKVVPPKEVAVLDPYWVVEWGNLFWKLRDANRALTTEEVMSETTNKLFREQPLLWEVSVQRLKHLCK